MHQPISGRIQSGYATLTESPWQSLGCALLAVSAIAGALAYRAHLAKKSDQRTPRFPKKRSVLKDDDSSSSAKPCATNSAFEYQLPDMLMLGNNDSYYYDQTRSNAVEEGPSDWKQEPMYVHPTAPDDLPIELWYPGDLPPKGSALPYSDNYGPSAPDSQESMMSKRMDQADCQVGSQMGSSQVDSQMGNQLGNSMDNQMGSQMGNTMNNSMNNQYNSQVGGQMGLDNTMSAQMPIHDYENGTGMSYGSMANMDQIGHLDEQMPMGQGALHAPVPIRMEEQQQNLWQKHTPEDPLTELESVLFNDAPAQQTAPIINYTPPSEGVVGNGQVWNSPPDSFHATSDTSPPLETVETNNSYRTNQSSQSPLLDFNMAYTEEPAYARKQFSVPAPLHMQRSHPYKIHKQPLSLHHTPSHLSHHHSQSQGVAAAQQQQQAYNLPSPPHSARGSSESGSDTNEEHAFKCPHCSASFRIRGYLTRHMKKHAEIMKFNCPFYRWLDPEHKCHQTGGFSRRDTFKMHLKARHFAYPTGTARKNRPNCAGRCCGCSEQFENNEKWIETHLLAGECPMDKAYHSHDPDSSY